MTPERWAAIALRCSIFAVFALFVFVPRSRAQGSPTAVNGVYCVASHIGQRAEYLSEIFGTREGDLSILGGAYKTYLTEKYSYESWGGGCYTYSTVAAAEEAKQKKLAELRQGRWAIEETGWKYTAPLTASYVPAVEPAAAPTAPFAATVMAAQANPSQPRNQAEKSYFCLFNDTSRHPNFTYYLTRAFQTDASLTEVRQAWANYIRQTYEPDDSRDQGTCQIGTADQQQRIEAQRRRLAQMFASAQASAPHKNNVMQTVVDVNWKYVPVSHATTASSSATAAAVAHAALPSAGAVVGQNSVPPTTAPQPYPRTAAEYNAQRAYREKLRAAAITGVYNGTYDCNPKSAKLKLSLVGAPDGSLTGIMTLDPPAYWGDSTAYSLKGRFGGGERGEDRFDVIPGEALGPAAPRGYSIAEMQGSYDPGSDMISGRTVTWLCDFHAVRDKAESVEIDKVMAAQRNPPPRPQAETPQPVAKTSVLLPPAPKGLVRKSREYWRDYGTDIIRQVFDGGFGSQVDQYVEFRVLFTTYVEMFSKRCSAVDPRFTAKYREYAQSLISKAQSLGPDAAESAFFDPGGDMTSFFQRETCKSAAMRQMGDNLLRGATGERSLQQVGATIPGAAAETDPSAVPGRYTHFVDGCNAYYRDPANSNRASFNSTQWCQCLSDHYRNSLGYMGQDQEPRYANDFKLFLNEVAPPSSTDPRWKLYHGAVVECGQPRIIPATQGKSK